MKNLALVLRLSLVDEATGDRHLRALLGEIDGSLGELAARLSDLSPGAESGEEPPAAPVDMGPRCDVLELLRRAHERHARLFEPEIRFHERIDVDRAIVPIASRRLERILLDLLLRARDVTPEGGIVRLQVERGDSFVRVIVQDGATETNAGTAAAKPGVELLAFWSRLIGAGNLTLQGRPGAGSTFIITLPTLT